MKSILKTLGLPVLVLATLAPAQINLPRQSPQASVSQTFAYTTATVTYSRPSVRDRAIWGGVVPFGQVWRAGANEATAIEFTTDVKVAGQALPKGKYALFVLPEKGAWTFIFDTNPKAWGAYAYDGKHDALRVTVAPKAAPHREQLEYAFEQVTDSSAVLTLHWEKLRASLPISAEFLETAKASIASGLSTAPKDNPYSYLGAARFYRQHKVDAAQAYAWVDSSIAIKPIYLNLWAKAEWLAQDQRFAEAVETGRKAWLEAAKDPALEPQLPALDKTLKAWEAKAKKK
jgi:hypothetical protein